MQPKYPTALRPDGTQPSKAASRAVPRGRKDHSTKPFAVFCKPPAARQCLFGRYATQLEAEAVLKQLFNVGCVVSIEAGANAPPHWFVQKRRTRDAINRLLRTWKSRSRISASEVAAELRERHRDIATGWFDFDTAVAAHLRCRSR